MTAAVSVILPWVRLDGYRRCLSALFLNCGNVAFEVVQAEDIHRVGCNPMVNKLIERSKYDIVAFLHDDSEPQWGFLKAAVNEMLKFDGSYGCIGFNDLQHGPDGPPTHWMIHKEMLKHFPGGVFYSEDYIHTRVDQELKDICSSVGRYKWVKNAKIIHHSRVNKGAKHMDDLARHCYCKKSVEHDRKVYEEHKIARQ